MSSLSATESALLEQCLALENSEPDLPLPLRIPGGRSALAESGLVPPADIYRGLMEKALTHYEANLKPGHRARMYSELAEAYRHDPSMGSERFAHARMYLEYSLEIREHLNDLPGLGFVHERAAHLTNERPRPSERIDGQSKAAFHYRKARDYFHRTALKFNPEFLDDAARCACGLAGELLHQCRISGATVEELEQALLDLEGYVNPRALPYLHPGTVISLAISRAAILLGLGRGVPEQELKFLRASFDMCRIVPDPRLNLMTGTLRRLLKDAEQAPLREEGRLTFDAARMRLENEFKAWDVNEDFSLMEEFFRRILRLRDDFPGEATPSIILELVEALLQTALPGANYGAYRDFHDRAVAREAVVNFTAIFLLEHEMIAQAILLLENYSSFRFKENYRRLTCMPHSARGRLYLGLSEVLGNYRNLFHQVSDHSTLLRVLREWDPISPRLKAGLLEGQLEKAREVQGKLHVQIQAGVAGGVAVRSLLDLVAGMEKGLGVMRKEIPQADLELIDECGAFFTYTHADLEDIAGRNPNRIFILLLNTGGDERLRGLSFALLDGAVVFRAHASTRSFKEGDYRAFIEAGPGRPTGAREGPDGTGLEFAEAIREITGEWLRRGIRRITFLPCSTGPGIIPWENLRDRKGRRLLEDVEGVSYCRSLVCFERSSLKRKPGRTRVYTGRYRDPSNRLDMGTYAAELCAEHGLIDHHGIASPDKLEAAAMDTAVLGLVCHGRPVSYREGARGISMILNDESPPREAGSETNFAPDPNHYWSAATAVPLPWHRVMSVHLWACHTAFPRGRMLMETHSHETFSMADEFMYRGTGEVLAPIYPVYDLTAALMSVSYYDFLKQGRDGEAAWNLTMRWFFEEASDALLRAYVVARTAGWDPSQSRRAAFARVMDEAMGLEPAPDESAGRAADENRELDEELSDFRALLNDSRNGSFILWKGGDGY